MTLTQCPHCRTAFRVTEAQLHAARGMVRCGSCLGLFSAGNNIVRLRDAESDDTSSAESAPAAPAQETPPFDDDDIALGDFKLDDEDEEDAEADDEDDSLKEAGELLGEEEEDEEEERTKVPEQMAFATYEEYKDIPDLFDSVDLPADETDEEAGEEEDENEEEESETGDGAYGEEEEDEAAEDDDQDDEPDEEFHPADGFDESEDFDTEEELPDPADVRAMLEQYDEEVGEEAEDEDDDATGASKPAWLRDQTRISEEKAQLRGLLATLEDEDDLGPLEEEDLAHIEDEPVTLDISRRKRSIMLAALGALTSLALLFTLVLQFVTQHLDQLVQLNRFNPYEPFFCAILECPPEAQPNGVSQLYSQELLIRTHPRVENALEVSFVFRNDASTPQPFPGLELSFRDIDENLLANRLFTPDEYLPPELRNLEEMPADSSLQIVLELVDPGPEAVNYTIAFRDL